MACSTVFIRAHRNHNRIDCTNVGSPVSSEWYAYSSYLSSMDSSYHQVLLNIVGGMNWPWFGPISNNSPSYLCLSRHHPDVCISVVTEFGVTLDQVNWLGNIVACIYLPTALMIPHLVSRYGIRRCVRRVVYLFSLQNITHRATVRYRSRFPTLRGVDKIRWNDEESFRQRRICPSDCRTGSAEHIPAERPDLHDFSSLGLSPKPCCKFSALYTRRLGST